MSIDLEYEKRLYFGGVSRGVLYDSDLTNGVAWNGIQKISFSFPGASRLVSYFDGETYLNTTDSGIYRASVEALTFPRSMGNLIGVLEDHIAKGIFIYNQSRTRGGFCYRTESNSGYTLHFVRNAMFFIENVKYKTKKEDPTFPLYEVSVHTFDKSDYRKVSSDSPIISEVEEIAYGSPTHNPSMPIFEDYYE